MLSIVYLIFEYLFVILPREIFGLNRLNFAPKGSESSSKNFLYLSYIEWDATFQRPHHLVKGLSKKHNVFYCAPIRAHNVDSLSWAFQNFERNISETLTVLVPLVLPGERLFTDTFINRIIRKINNKIVLNRLIQYLNRKKIDNLIIYTNSPFFLDVINGLKYDFLIYDVMDDLISLPWSPKNAPEIEDELFGLSDLVLTGTYSLYELKSSKHKNIHFIQCGVDYKHFALEGVDKGEKPFDLANIKKPIIGYFGALNERLDCELLSKIAQGKSNWSLVMIGPKYEGVVDLPKSDNIFYLGKKHYRDLPKYLAEFDVTIVPYTLKGGTQYVNPVKILEYLAGGKPVVSTAIPDVKRFFSEFVYLAESHAEFIDKIEMALKDNSLDMENKRRDFAKKRSWDVMVNEITSLYKKTLSTKELSTK